MMIRIIKLVCFLISCILIFMVLPASAAVNGGYKLSDFVSGSTVLDDTEIVYYNFNSVTPFIRFSDNIGTQYQAQYSLPKRFDLNAGSKTHYLFYYPLGYRYSAGNSLSDSGFLDVRDVLPGSSFIFSTTWRYDLDVQSYNVEAARIGTSLFCLSFDENGKFLSVENTATFWADSELYGEDPYVCRYIYSFDFDFVVPANASYIVPYFTSTVITGENVEVPSRLTLSEAGLTGQTDINVFVKESAEMKVIQNKLDETNDKLDDIGDQMDELITGSPEDQESADIMASDADNFKDLSEKLEQDMNGLYEPDANDIDLSIDGLMMGNGSWLSSFGNVWSYLVSDRLWQQILTIVASFTWVGTLLFGKRG